MSDHKKELAKMCAVQIRQASVIAMSRMSDYGYHFVESVFDGEFWSMIPRLDGKPVTETDMPLLRELVMEDLWPRLREQHRDLRNFLFGKLPAKYPEVFAADTTFAFDPGWRPLLQAAAERIETYPESWKVRIVGGKEKFGCLVLHIGCDYSQRGCRSEVERLREDIRLRSLCMCDICGEQGRLRIGNWAKTVCDKHAPVLGEFREDDGKWSDPWKWNEEDELADVQAGLDDLDRGESVPIDEVLDKARAIVADAVYRKRQSADEYPPESAEVLKDLKPVRQRPKHHVVDLVPQTTITRQIEADIRENFGHKADLLFEFVGQIELAVVAAMSVEDKDVDFWFRCEVERWQGVQPLSDDDRAFLLQYLRSLAIDERGRRDRRRDGAEALQRFLADHPDLAAEAVALVGRERELLDEYAGALIDSACGRVVKEEFVDGYVRTEVSLWPGIDELSDDDCDWLRHWLRRMIDAEYERIK